MPVAAETTSTHSDSPEHTYWLTDHGLEKRKGTNPTSQSTDRNLGRVASLGTLSATKGFYNGGEYFETTTPDNKHVIIVQGSGPAGKIVRNEVVGIGDSPEAALEDSLMLMRQLETVRTRFLARIEMAPNSSVSFTALEHYNPKIAPGSEAYAIPDYLKPMIVDKKSGLSTYRNTEAVPGWQHALRNMLEAYIAQDSNGRLLAESLKINSLSTLTPEQAVKLSVAFVQDLSKYSYSDVDHKGLTRADQSTAMQLLKEGLDNKSNANWQGNGVCRNIAANVKAVFEALKQTQGELSMLNNTYCAYSVGFYGAGYADARPNYSTYNSNNARGHAWDTFVTVGPESSSVATIVDATWALDIKEGGGFEHLDRTEARAIAQVIELFKKSTDKTEAFYGLTKFIENVISHSYVYGKQLGKDDSARQDLREYATSAYLDAIARLPEVPEGFGRLQSLVSCAYQMRGRLEPIEIVTLFRLNDASGGTDTERLIKIIKGYDSNRGDEHFPPKMCAERLLFNNLDLQELAYQALSKE
jgi:hypothetical protein